MASKWVRDKGCRPLIMNRHIDPGYRECPSFFAEGMMGLAAAQGPPGMGLPSLGCRNGPGRAPVQPPVPHDGPFPIGVGPDPKRMAQEGDASARPAGRPAFPPLVINGARFFHVAVAEGFFLLRPGAAALRVVAEFSCPISRWVFLSRMVQRSLRIFHEKLFPWRTFASLR